MTIYKPGASKSCCEVESSGQIASRCTKLAAKEEIRRYLHCSITHVLRKKERDLIQQRTDRSPAMISMLSRHSA